jgi:hypothetical protein
MYSNIENFTSSTLTNLTIKKIIKEAPLDQHDTREFLAKKRDLGF